MRKRLCKSYKNIASEYGYIHSEADFFGIKNARKFAKIFYFKITLTPLQKGKNCDIICEQQHEINNFGM